MSACNIVSEMCGPQFLDSLQHLGVDAKWCFTPRNTLKNTNWQRHFQSILREKSERHVTCETLSEWSGDVYIWPVPLKTDREPVKQGTRQVAWLEGPVKIFGGEISNLVLASLPLRIRKNWKLTILGDRLHFGCFYLDNPGAPVIIDPKFCPLPISRTWFSLTLIARWWV